MPTNDPRPDGWPSPHENQARVLLLGTYHMDNPGLDANNVDADDVLTDRRQRELRDIADRLTAWQPDHVAVERPRDWQAAVTDVYRSYREGELDYDEEVTVDPPHPERNDPTTECRSEVVQIGFRVADRLDHDRVHAVDSHPDPHGLDESVSWESPVSDEVPYPVPDFEDYEEREAERLRESTIVEYLREINVEDRLRTNHAGMFGAAVPRGSDEDYLGARMLGHWYERNLRMIQNCWDAVEGVDDRLLLVVGTGHVHVLRHLLDDAPMFCPVSPLPYLT